MSSLIPASSTARRYSKINPSHCQTRNRSKPIQNTARRLWRRYLFDARIYLVLSIKKSTLHPYIYTGWWFGTWPL